MIFRLWVLFRVLFLNFFVFWLCCVVTWSKYSRVQEVYEFLRSQWRQFHCSQLWDPPEGWKIGFLLWNFFYKIICMLIIYMPNFKARRLDKKRYLKSTNMCSCEFWLLWCCQLCHPSKDWNFFFPMFFFSWDHFYVYNMCSKFQVQEIYPQKGIWNTNMCRWKRQLHYCKLYHPPKDWRFFLLLWNFFRRSSLCW